MLFYVTEHWKNFLRLHIDENGDLEIFAIGLHRVPKSWIKDPLFKQISTTPSWLWKTPSKWAPEKNSKKCTPEIVDYTKIKKKKS